MQYNLREISEITNGTLHINGDADIVIDNFVIDSRKINNAENSLFFALKVARNGHDFIADVIKQGVKNIVISDVAYANSINAAKANYIVVPNTLDALQVLATHYRKKFSYPVIGITGSNGKTFVKEWLYQLLRESLNIVRSPKSYNSQIGVPLSVMLMQEENTLGIFEAGISMPGEMQQLQKIIQPTIGIFTNAGTAHDENFKSQDEKIIEKLQLFIDCNVLVFCKDHVDVFKHISHLVHEHKNIKPFSWAREHKADLEIGKIDKQFSETTIEAFYNQHPVSIRIPFVDDASIENAINCWCLMLVLGLAQKLIEDKMLLLAPVAMRLEMKEGINNCSIINDSYNSDISSITIALDFLNQQKQHPKHTVILSDILQSGRDEKELYVQVANMLHKKNVQRLIGIGPALMRQQKLFSKAHDTTIREATFYATTEDFLMQYQSNLFEDETILIKGARLFEFERISNLLQQKAHETVLEINLNALIHNLNFYRSLLSPETDLMCMVKAFAYGSGSFEIANTLQFHRVPYLAVAYTDEGIDLRKGGITLPVMVMNPEAPSFNALIEYNLEPEIYSFSVLNAYSEIAKRKNKSEQLRIHIKLDTGMHRLGFEENDMPELIEQLHKMPHLIVQSVFSHLAGSDEQAHDGFTHQQIELFERMSATLQQALAYPVKRHILNSAGIVRFANSHFEMVRLGIGLHGIGSTELEKKMLEPVSTLKTTISQIKNIAAGQTIGYSRKGKAEKNIRIATVAIGYADGLSRRLSNGVGSMLVGGKLAPIIGNVCMDMCMLNVTDIDCNEGDVVVVFGKEHPIELIAKQTETIAYEVLTGISQRVKRVYFHE